MKNRSKNLLILGVILIVSSVVSVSIIFNLESIRPYSWDTDPTRLEFRESASNITLIIDYGPSNGTIEKHENITLEDHYTTPFDLINEHSLVEYKIYWQGDTAVFYVSSINSLWSSCI